MTTTTERRVTCRYLRRNDEQCTGEAIDPNADVLICSKHAARVMALVRTGIRNVTGASRP
jgi:hypothetical protein